MRPGKRDRRGRWVFQKLDRVEEEMQSFMETPGCRRVIINYGMDGRENRIVCKAGEALCSNYIGRIRQ
jgi:hypothetical protein